MKNNYNILIVLIIIVLLHYITINGLEKMLFDIYFTNKSEILRPIESCHKLRNIPINCLGMPSGHTELTTLASFILYNYNYITLPIVFLLIIAMCIQRVLFKRHTILQTIVGVIFGFIYSILYLNIKNNYLKVGFALFIIFFYINLILYEITKKLNTPLPKWIDKQMYPSINKKKNIDYYLKCFSIIIPSIRQNILYITWNDVEYYLDQIIEEIQNSNIKYDGIVGIKTGGAIISDYISNKLNIKNYKIKIKEKKYGSNPSTDITTFTSMWYNKYYLKNSNYVIYEDIKEDISNKNIILIDESISSGVTMQTGINYLIKKKVNKIFPVVINTINDKEYNIYRIISRKNICIWPWGYDN